MPKYKISKSELKRVGNELAAEADRTFAPARPTSKSLTRSRERLVKLLTESSGADINDKKLAALRDEHASELRRLADARLARAVEGSARSRERFAALSAERRKSLEGLSDLVIPALPHVEVLLRPFLTWAAPKSNIISASDSPAAGDSWAKVRIETTSSRSDTLSFYYLWSNDSEFYAVVNVRTLLSVTGHVRTFSDGDVSSIWDVGTTHGEASISAQLQILKWWEQPPVPGAFQSVPVAWVRAESAFLNDVETKDLDANHGLAIEHFVIPPQSVIVIQVSLQMYSSVDDGSVAIDFESGEFAVLCPSVVVEVLTEPVGGVVGPGGGGVSP